MRNLGGNTINPYQQRLQLIRCWPPYHLE